MSFEIKKLYLCVMAVLLNLACFGAESDKAGKSPLDELPPYIKQVTYFGERADWSHDGKKILFLSKTFGDVFEVELATGKIHLMTGHFYHEGYTRALYLTNGDILLSGARKFDAENPQPSRSGKNAELWVLKKDLSSPPLPLGEHCSEGPAVSRKRMTIAWTLMNEGLIYMGDIVYENGNPKLINKKLILDANNLPFKSSVETQNFRPPDEKELIFSAYNYQGSEVMGLDISTGKVVNYSNAPGSYEEPEGIFPDGKYTLVECDRHNPRGNQYIDIYRLALDGSGQMERLTRFADYPGYKASNPVVSDDGVFIAFQYARVGDQAGVGRGILILDIKGYEATKPNTPSEVVLKQETSNLIWGREVNGLRAAVEFVPEKESYSIGEKIGTRMLVKNVSGKSLNKVNTIGQWIHGQSDIVDEQGKSVPFGSIMWAQEQEGSPLQMVESGEILVYDGPKIDIRGYNKDGTPGHTMGGSIVYLHPGQYAVIFKLDFDRKIILKTGKHNLVIEPNNQP